MESKQNKAANFENNQHNVFEPDMAADRFAVEGRDLQNSFDCELDVEHTAVASSCSLEEIACKVVDYTRVRQSSSDVIGSFSFLQLD